MAKQSYTVNMASHKKAMPTYEQRSGHLQMSSPFWNCLKMLYRQSSEDNIQRTHKTNVHSLWAKHKNGNSNNILYGRQTATTQVVFSSYFFRCRLHYMWLSVPSIASICSAEQAVNVNAPWVMLLMEQTGTMRWLKADALDGGKYASEQRHCSITRRW